MYKLYFLTVLGVLFLCLSIGLNGQEEQTTSSNIEVDIDKLIKQLNDDDFEIREAVSAKIIKRGKEAVTGISKIIETSDLEIQNQLLNILKKIITGKDKDASNSARTLVQDLSNRKNHKENTKLAKLVQETVFTKLHYEIYGINIHKEKSKENKVAADTPEGAAKAALRIMMSNSNDVEKHGVNIYLRLKHPHSQIKGIGSKCELTSFTDDKGVDLIKKGIKYHKENVLKSLPSAIKINGMNTESRITYNGIGSGTPKNNQFILFGNMGKTEKSTKKYVDILINVMALPEGEVKELTIAGLVELLLPDDNIYSMSVKGQDLFIGFDIDGQQVKLVDTNSLSIKSTINGKEIKSPKRYKIESGEKVEIVNISGEDIDANANNKDVISIDSEIEGDKEYKITYKKIKHLKVPLSFKIKDPFSILNKSHEVRVIE